MGEVTMISRLFIKVFFPLIRPLFLCWEFAGVKRRNTCSLIEHYKGKLARARSRRYREELQQKIDELLKAFPELKYRGCELSMLEFQGRLFKEEVDQYYRLTRYPGSSIRALEKRRGS